MIEHYFLPADLERRIGAFVAYCTTRRYHKSLGNLTPADVYVGRTEQILKQREEIKRKTMIVRRLRHETENAYCQPKKSQSLRMKKRSTA
ncbi:hypothetical protein [Aliiruegeria lutimaris]|uniref:hypothetical protein n=1 Tax=Aliiruegeria lutimaris TaxID=571298 RepID=UPI000B83D11B